MKTRYWYWIWKTFLGPSRLRKKFVRTFILAGLIPLIMMVVATLYFVEETHKIDVEALEKNVAKSIASEIKKSVDDAVSVIELTVTFKEFAPIAFNEQDLLLEGIIRDKNYLSEVSFVCLTPRQCKAGQETKRWSKNSEGVFANPTLRNRNEDPAFLKAKAGENYIGRVEFTEKGPVVPLAAPVYNIKAEKIAVLTAEMNLSPVQETVSKTQLGKSGYTYLVDAEGKIIAHGADKTQIGKDALAYPAVTSILNKGPADYWKNAYDNWLHEPVNGSGEIIEGIGWAVIAEWPTAENEAPLERIYSAMAVFLLFTLLVIAVIASWRALKLIQPIATLRQGTSIIGSGNFDYRVNIKTGDELEDLGNNLNKMAENLKGLEEVKALRVKTEALAASLKKEQELSKLKDQFITTVSHQLNTPLSVIKWAASELNEPAGRSKKIKESSEIILKSQQDIASIVNDLVTLSEVGFKYEKTKAKPTDIVRVINKAIESFKDPLDLKKIKITFRAEVKNPEANVNQFMMTKAIENLIDNAIGYSNEGGRIEVNLSESEKELTFKISDTGIGIPKEDQPSIFEQFFRGRNAVSKKNVGTGLGLFISKNIVEGHGGKIWFTSEENKGSSFYIAIPR